MNTKFKIGDRVRVISAEHKMAGHLGEILDENITPDVWIDDVGEWGEWSIHQDYLELIPEQLTPEICQAKAKEIYEAPPTEPHFGTEEKESICMEAYRIQGGDRQQDYGSPAKNFQEIADSWNTYLKTACGVEVNMQARDVAHMNILMKICRNVHKPKRDNWVDMAGYAQCGGKVDDL